MVGSFSAKEQLQRRGLIKNTRHHFKVSNSVFSLVIYGRFLHILSLCDQQSPFDLCLSLSITMHLETFVHLATSEQFRVKLGTSPNIVILKLWFWMAAPQLLRIRFCAVVARMCQCCENHVEWPSYSINRDKRQALGRFHVD